MTTTNRTFCKKVIKYCICGYIYYYHPYIGYTLKAIQYFYR